MSLTRFSLWRLEKNPHLLPAGEEESNNFEILLNSVLLNKGFPQGKLFHQSVTDTEEAKSSLKD